MQELKRHSPFWILIYIVWTFMKSGGGEKLGIYLLINLVNIPIYMAAFYTLKYVQIPYLLNKGKYVLFVLSLAFMSFVLYLFWRINGVLWMDEIRGLKNIPFMNFLRYLTYSVQFYSPAMALLAWDNHLDKIKERERLQELEKEKLATELKYLKAQLNPHFLFNTLNNLYSYVIMQSPKAPDMILRLSGILDYVLYRSQQKTVPLKEEVETIEHFLELEKIRYGERLNVRFEAKGNLDIPVSPLLLLSLVENAFKHGASGDIDSPEIVIDLLGEEDYIGFNVWNTKSKYKGRKTDDYKEGIGLSNIKRQLNLIYPQKHTISIDETETTFTVLLTIQKEL